MALVGGIGAVLSPCLLHAEERPSAPAKPAAQAGTLKERLSDKASDEQRVDNCNVPPEKRGAKKRPDACPPQRPAAARK